VAEAKQEMYLRCPEALHIYNIDNQFTIKMYEERMKSHHDQPPLTFSGFRKSDKPVVCLRSTSMNLLGMDVQGVISGVEGQCRVPIFGRHNVSNLMAAASLALAAGMKGEEIWEAMPLCRTSWGRNQILGTKAGFTVVFDAYNANPDSMGMLVRSLMEVAPEGKLVLVLADMLELGDDAHKLHEELGALVGEVGAHTVWFIGEYGDSFKRGIKSSGFDNTLMITDAYEEKLAKEIGSMLSDADLAVVKGSRGMELERVVHAWNPTNF
jgi:UDP-N-acetylmuramoyl-tripeptide--D-alanyl-D-alanine ligase